MENEKGLQVLEEVQKTVDSVKKDAGMISKKSFSSDLLDEDIHAISLDGFAFEDVSTKIFDATEELFYLSRACNRFAPQYLLLCRTLKRSIEHLGGVFMTKSALKRNGVETPKLDLLTAVRLNEMCSFNFRKLEELYHQKKQKDQIYDLEVINLMLDYANLMARLRTSESKAINMEFGFGDTLKYIKGCSSFATNRKGEKKHSDPASFREAPAFPVDHAVVVQMEGKTAETVSDVPSEGKESDSQSDCGTVVSDTSVPEPGHIESDTAVPDEREKPVKHLSYQEILTNAKARNEDPKSREIQLTIEEIHSLLADVSFRRNEPVLAAQLMAALNSS